MSQFHEDYFKDALIMKRYKVITLCGSLKFQRHFNDVQMLLERNGHVCFSVGFSEVDYEEPSPDEKRLLDKVHFKKIAMSDCILVIDINGYVGESTRNEIEFAQLNNIPIIYLRDTGYLEAKSFLIHYIFNS